MSRADLYRDAMDRERKREEALLRLNDWAYDVGIRGVTPDMSMGDPVALVEAITRECDMVRAVATARVVTARKQMTDLGEAEIIEAGSC